MNDSNNNNDNNNDDGLDKNIDLNRNKNGRSSFSVPLESIENDLDIMKDTQTISGKAYEDGNINLLMKSETKVFCESKQLDCLSGEETNIMHFERFSSEDEDEECCNVVPNSFESSTIKMDFDDDDLADLSGEDDAAIKNELENIDKADNEFHENIDCDLATYLQQYDFKMDLKKTYKYESEQTEEDDDDDDECLTDEDNCKLPTPDILIEHNSNNSGGSSKKLQNSEIKDAKVDDENKTVCHEGRVNQRIVDVSQSEEMRDYQPDLIKNIADTIKTNDNNEGDDDLLVGSAAERMRRSEEGDNEISSLVECKIPNNERKTNDNDEKIINQVQTETVGNVGDDDDDDVLIAAVSRNLPLSFESATSTTVDIIGDFEKEIEKEIGLIVSGYRNATNKMCSAQILNDKKATQPSGRTMRSRSNSTKSTELVFDENKFIEHLKYFSKVSLTSKENLFLSFNSDPNNLRLVLYRLHSSHDISLCFSGESERNENHSKSLLRARHHLHYHTSSLSLLSNLFDLLSSTHHPQNYSLLLPFFLLLSPVWVVKSQVNK